METVIDQKDSELKTNSVLLTARETAAYMKLSPKFGYISVQRWAREGKLRGGRVGDHWLFRLNDIEDFIFSKR